jgi:AraC-like DNA-binding protein/mannose-6-phosphate isomerase-like protein (cupin superfamily)
MRRNGVALDGRIVRFVGRRKRQENSLFMSKSSECAEGHAGSLRFDVFTDVIDQVHLEGTVYFSAELHAPWGIAIARRGRTPFYLVREGKAELQVGRGRTQLLAAGDFVLLPNAAPHVVRSGRDARIVAFDDWLALHPMDAAGRSVHPGRGDVTRVIGGFFSSATATSGPLFSALPPVIVQKGSDPRVRRWLEPTLAFIEAEIDSAAQGGKAVLQRMADVLFIQAVRAHAAQADGATGWLRGMSDRRIAHALALLHEHYAQAWTLNRLAREVGMSRTALAVRFRELVGEAPMAYLTRWRITRAGNLLRAEGLDLERAAERVGYGSGTVFAKAFKRVTGEAPGRYRRHVEAEAAPH